VHPSRYLEKTGKYSATFYFFTSQNVQYRALYQPNTIKNFVQLLQICKSANVAPFQLTGPLKRGVGPTTQWTGINTFWEQIEHSKGDCLLIKRYSK